MEADKKLEGQYVTFKIGNELFAADVFLIREILEVPEITKIPGMPEYMNGIINIRGNVVPVLDLRMKFGEGKTEKTDSTAIIVSELSNGENELQIGFLVDQAEQVHTFDAARIEEAPAMKLFKDKTYILGMGKLEDDKFVLILDMEKILTQEEIALVQDSAS